MDLISVARQLRRTRYCHQYPSELEASSSSTTPTTFTCSIKPVNTPKPTSILAETTLVFNSNYSHHHHHHHTYKIFRQISQVRLIALIINRGCHNNIDERNHAATMNSSRPSDKTRQREKAHQIPIPKFPSHAKSADNSFSVPSAIMYASPDACERGFRCMCVPKCPR